MSFCEPGDLLTRLPNWSLRRTPGMRQALSSSASGSSKENLCNAIFTDRVQHLDEPPS
jgi:hypothetical protein